jgi:hypothetical protein
MIAFVYCWTDHKTKKLYIGSHKGDTNEGYVSSSKPMMKEYTERPSDFTREILAEGDYEVMRKFEASLLLASGAQYDDDFYNQSNGNGRFYCAAHTDETKQKMSSRRKGRPKSEETKQKMREAAKERVRNGWVELSCFLCEKPFKRKKSQVNNPERSFCSHRCYRKAGLCNV